MFFILNRKSFLIILFIVLKLNAIGQPNSQSIFTYGFDGDFSGTCVSNSEIVYVGTATDSITLDQKLICLKTDVNGIPLWSLSAASVNYSQGDKICVLSNGDYLVSGVYENAGIAPQLMLLRISASGNLIWSKIYTVSNSDLTDATLVVDNDDNIIVASSKGAFSNSKGVVFKIDGNGLVIWSKEYSYQSLFVPSKLILANDGGFVICGRSDYTEANGYLLKIDSIGTPQWGRKIKADTALLINSVLQNSDGNIYAVGTVNYLHSPDVILLKMDSLGNVLNSWTYGSVNHDAGIDFALNAAGTGFIISGSSFFISATSYLLGSLILETDLNGSLMNYWFIQLPNLYHVVPYAMAINGNQIIQCGVMYGLAGIPNGPWIHQTGLSSICNDDPISILPRQSVIVDSTGFNVSPITITPYNINFNVNSSIPQFFDYCWTSGINENLQDQSLLITPNPCTDQISIDLNTNFSEQYNLQVFNSSGSIVIDQTFNSTDVQILDTRNLDPGFYFLKAYSTSKVLQSKFVKL